MVKEIDFIQGQKFIELADFVFTAQGKQDYNPLVNTFDTSKVFENCIIYTHTLYIQELFKELGKLNIPVIVVSHNSDVNITNSFVIPNCVKKWYTQNVSCVNKKIQSIPIGLENDKWFPKMKKKEYLLEKLTEQKKQKGLLYINHNVHTNFKERAPIYDYFEKKCKCWCTIEKGKNGQDYNHYIDQIYNHAFTICPEGNGIDTHRLWETLYLKSIPVVKWNMNTSYYKELPICFVNQWEEVDEVFLIREANRIRESFWNLEKLDFAYWKQLI